MIEDTPKYFRSYSPNHRVKFIDPVSGEEVIDASNDLVSLSTNKAYGRAAGTWQMMLTYNNVTNKLGEKGRYHEHIRPDDIVTIEFDAGDGTGYVPVMLGLVDRAAPARPGGNIPQRQVKISGQDMGKLLLKHDVGWDITAFNLITTASGDSDKPEISRQINRQFDVSLTVKTAKDLIEKLFQQTFKDALPKMAPMFDIDTTGTLDDWILYNPAIVNLQGCSIWSIMTKCMHDPFNVLTTETRSVKDFLVTLEAQPIDDFGRLIRNPDRQHTIFETDIIGDDVGVSDVERINFLFYNPQFYLSAAGMSVPVAMAHPDLIEYLESSIETHGYCPKTFQDEFVPPTTTWHAPMTVPPNTEWLENAKQAKTKLWNWYKLNHTYWSGTFHIHLNPAIKAGDELRHDNGEDKIMQYLVEQVAHQYIVWPQPQFVTTLSVTRGQLL